MRIVKYRPEWSLKMPAEPLDESPFSFGGKTYRAHPVGKVLTENFRPSAIYLDLNSSFSKPDFDKISALARSKNIPLRANVIDLRNLVRCFSIATGFSLWIYG